jgi:hypothetical protein
MGSGYITDAISGLGGGPQEETLLPPHPAQYHPAQYHPAQDAPANLIADIGAALSGRCGRWRCIIAIVSAATAVVSASLIIVIGATAIAPALLSAT